MVAGPGAAYICDTCLQLCNEILNEPAPFSTKALELASRPPVVIAAPRLPELQQGDFQPDREPLRTIILELEQKQQQMTLMLHQIQYYQSHFELHYLWIRPPLTTGFAFLPRLIFLLKDNLGTQWSGDRGGTMIARPELTHNPDSTVYQGSARFRPLPARETRTLTIQAADPLAQFEDPTPAPWTFEVTLL